MKSKTSFYSIPAAVIREDFRRFWAIPVLAFIGYFLFGLLPVIVQYGLLTENGGADAMILGATVDAILCGQNPFLIINMAWVPLLSGLLVFSYLHRTGSVMSVHSQPVTRSSLFCGHFLSCVLFAVLPLLLTGIVLLIMASPIYDTGYETFGSQAAYYYGDQTAETARNVFARAGVVKWIWDCILVSLYILAITVFGGMITGTSLHHFIAAVGFNGIVPLCYLLLIQYFGIYLFGYDSGSFSMAGNLHPLIASVDNIHFSLKESLIWLLITALIIAFSLLLYRKRRLERATDGVVFKAANVAITLIFGFLGMSLLGLMFHEAFDYSPAITVFGYVAGAVLAMVVIRMIIMKTIRVFDRGLLKMMISYLIVACVFFAVIVLDLTGFESKVPGEGEADGVKIEGIDFTDAMTEGRTEVTFDDPESVALAEALHRELTEMEDASKKAADYEMTSHVQLTYFTGNPDSDDYREILSRSYTVPSGLLYSCPALADLEESSEISEYAAGMIDIDEESIISSSLIPLQDRLYSSEGAAAADPAQDVTAAVTLSREETQELYRIYAGEMKKLSGKEQIALGSSMNCYEFDVFRSGKDEKGNTVSVTDTFYIRIGNRDTVTWLKEHGYMGSFSDGYRCAAVSLYELDAEGWTQPQFLCENIEPDTDERSVVISDKSVMEALFSAMRESVYDLGTEESLLGTGKVYYLTFWNSYDDYMTGYIAADDIPQGVTLPSAS